MSTALVLFSGGAWGQSRPGTAQEPILLLTEENPPSNFAEQATGRVRGLATDKLMLVMEITGIPYEVRLVGWPEAYATAQSNPRACVFLTNLTEERRPLFQWVSPLMLGGWALFARPDWPVKVERVEDIRPYRIGVQAGSALENYLRNLEVQVGALQLVPLEGTGAWHRLQSGDVDLLANGLWNAPYQSRAEGVAIKLAWRLHPAIGAMACNKAMDPDLIARMQAALDQITDDGRAAMIDEAYGSPSDWARRWVPESR